MSNKVEISTRPAYVYLLCGWYTRSDIPFISVPPSVHDGESIDIVVQFAHGPSPMAKCEARVVFEHSPGCSLIAIKDVADFEVRRGRQIRVWPAAGATQKDIEIFLLGPAWGALCHQRGLLPLHASAIVTGGGITAFAGHCGSGKSTTAALMGSLGYALVADDILPISFNQDSIPGAWPYLRRLKLQNDSIVQLALTPTELVSETLDKEKFFVFPKYVADDEWSRLERIYLLEIDPAASDVSIDRITGAEAVHALIDHTYNFHFIVGSGRFRNHLVFCAQLANKIPIFRLRRPSVDIEGRLAFLVSLHLKEAESCQHAQLLIDHAGLVASIAEESAQVDR